MSRKINAGTRRYLGPKDAKLAPEKVEFLASKKTAPEKVFKTKAKVAALAMSLSISEASSCACPPEAPNEIVELARALKHDVDLIYEWTYSNVDFYCMWGQHKGSFGTYIDKVGGSFEQSSLMVDLLRQSGYIARFVKGSIRLTKAQLENLLGTTETDSLHPSQTMLEFGNIPNTPVYDGGGVLEYIDFEHVWVQVEICGSRYVFDPTIKTYEYISGIDIGTATEYDQGQLITDAMDGATSGDTYIQNLNRENIHADFKSYGTNLLNYIRTNAFAASMKEIIGGRSIEPLSSQPVRQITLPYQTPGDTPTYFDEIPDSSKATYRVEFGGIDETFYTPDIYGKRLSLKFNGEMEPELRLEGELVATGTAQAEDVFVNAEFTVTHPFADTSADQNWTQPVYTDPASLYLLSTAFGPVSQGMVDYHRQVLQQNTFDGGAEADENVLGESLAVYFFMHRSQHQKLEEILEALATSTFFGFHFCGLTQYNSYFQGPAFDLAGVLTGQLSRVGDEYMPANLFAVDLFYGAALEGSIFQQSLAGSGVSAIKMLDAGCAAGQKMFNANGLSWSSVEGDLVNWDDYLAAMENIVVFEEGVIVVHEDGETSVGSFVGGGWVQFLYNEISDRLTGQIAGGGLDEPASKGQTNGGAKKAAGTPQIPPQMSKKTIDPVSLVSGAALYDKLDMSVGSSSFPYALEFSRSYNSASRLTDGALGLGWTHNFATSISLGSDGMRAAGDLSPKEAAGTIAHAFAMIQLALGVSYPVIIDLTNVLIGIVSTQWLFDSQFTNNAVSIKDVAMAATFVRLIDDTEESSSFNPPPGFVGSIIENMDGSFTFKSPQQHEWNFDEEGKLETYIDPAGVTISYTYISGLLSSVTNGLGRTFSFSYTDGKLTSVSDGNGRTVGFGFDAYHNLTEFTDAEEKTTRYEYCAPGQMSKIFLPANPETAVMTNAYDSLGRVKSQSGSETGTSHYFLAGSRSEEVDPLGSRHIMYYNSYGSVEKDINALGQETITERDGLNRQIKVTLPEGNSTEWNYDENNNPLTVTQIAKPGSGLANIVLTFTYDPDWNKVATATDGNGNTTSFTYDETQGTLVTIERPEIDMQVPTVTMTFNARGQILTREDETGIVDAFEYDSGTEVLEQVTSDYGMGRLNLVTAFGYDAVGNTNSVTDPNGNETTFEFDAERRKIQQTDPAPFSFVTTWQYDANGWQTGMKKETGDPANPLQTWKTIYQVNGSVKKTIDPAGFDTLFAYNTNNWLVKRTDAEGRVWQYQHDSLGRGLLVIDPLDHAAETRAYTENGMLASIEDARHNKTNYEYDGFDRLKKRIYPDLTFEEYEYDHNGNVLTLTTRNEDEIVNSYDVLNRLSTRQPGALPLQSMTYDLTGRQLSIGTPPVMGDPGSGEFSWGYDTAGRLILQEMPDGKTVGYQLDANGNRTRLTYPDGYYAEYVFDELNRLADIKLNGAGTAAIHFDYDELSRRTLLTYENGAECSYGYSINNDLRSLAHAFTGSFVGNSVSVQFSYNKVHQVSGMSCDNSQYVWTPRMSRSTVYAPANNLNQYPAVAGAATSYNVNGCQTEGSISGTALAASFDELNRLTQAVKGAVTNDYLYDPTNRQAQKSVNSVKTRLLYDGQQLIEEYDDAGDLVCRYMRGNGLDEIFIKIEASGSTKTYLHHDRLGSVIAITDDTGALLEIYTYGPFGETSSVSNTSFGYTGQRYDSELGLYNYKARYYNPALGRFLQPDPIGFAAGDLNLYGYVGNDPCNLTDFMGLAAVDPRLVNQMASVLSDPRRIGSGTSGTEFGGALGNRGATTRIYSNQITAGQSQLMTPMYISEAAELGFKGQVPVATWHSHPNIPGYGAEYFSPQDIINANGYNLNSYLLTPTGWVLNYQGNQMANSAFYNLSPGQQVAQAAGLGTSVGWFNQKGEYFEAVPLPKGQYGPLQVKPASCGY